MSASLFAPPGGAQSSQLRLSGVSFSYDGASILHDVTLTVSDGDRMGVVGLNGSGKSTLLRLMAGHLLPSAGTVTLLPPTATVGLLTQELSDLPGETITQVAERRSGLHEAVAEFEAATEAWSEAAGGNGDAAERVAVDRYDRALARYLAHDPAQCEHRLTQALQQVGLGQVAPTQGCQHLSGGQRTRLNLALLVLARHDIVLLDEPTNNLDRSGLDLLEQAVSERAGATVIVSHDRAFLSATTTAIAELDPHSGGVTVYHGGYDSWQQERVTARRHHQAAYNEYRRQHQRLSDQARQQRQWAAKGAARARRSDEPDKTIRNYRIETSENLAAKAKTTERALARLEPVEKPWEPWVLRLRFATGQRSAGRVAELSAVTVRRGGFVLGPPGDEIHLQLWWGDRMLITGPNGAGKTTLLNVLLGEHPPDSGTAHLAANAKIGFLHQHHPFLDHDDRLLDGFAAATSASDPEARSQLAKFGLTADHLSRRIGSLSPGERIRATLAVFALTERNVLVFDEPTNHLDLEAIEELETALSVYDGTLVAVSHDRRLLENITATRHIQVHDGIIFDR